jgi:hypothetical protein
MLEGDTTAAEGRWGCRARDDTRADTWLASRTGDREGAGPPEADPEGPPPGVAEAEEAAPPPAPPLSPASPDDPGACSAWMECSRWQVWEWHHVPRMK